MNHAPQSQTTGNSWRLLYLVGAAAAVIAVLFFRRNCGAELTAFRGFGIWDVPATPPVSPGEWFDLFQSDPFVGLALGQFVALAIAPAILWLPPTISALFRLAWYILIAMGLFRLARSEQ